MTQINPLRDALLIVDMQRDFMPGGALPVKSSTGSVDEDMAAIVSPVGEMMASGPFRIQVATQDWHPPAHVSFAGNHPGQGVFDNIDLYGHEQTLWPDHCVQGTEGAAIHHDLPLDCLSAIVRKGMDDDADSYSGFRNNWGPSGKRASTGLAGYLSERGIDSLYCCGLARDVCVKWTAEDAASAGFKSYFIWDLTWPVDPDNDERVRRELESKGVEIVTCDTILNSGLGRGV